MESLNNDPLFRLYLQYKQAVPKCRGQPRHKLVYLAAAILKSMLRLQLPSKTQVQLRLELAALLVNETASLDYAQQVISKGILIALENRLDYLKIQLQLLSVQLLATSHRKAAIKLAESCYSDSRVLQDPWLIATCTLTLLTLDSHPENPLYAELCRSCPFAHVRVLSAILHSFKYLTVGAIKEADLCLKSIDDIGQGVELYPQLACMRRCAELLVALGYGDPQAVQAAMGSLHSVIEAQRDDGSDNWIGWDSNGLVSLVTEPSRYSPITIKWYPKYKVFTLSYLLSGIASLHNGKTKAASKFFEEGIKLAKTEKNHLLFPLLFYSSLRCFTNSDTEMGLKYLQQLQVFAASQNNGTENLPLYIHYLYGIYFQSIRKLDQATQAYMQATSTATRNYVPGAKDLHMFASLNLILLAGPDANKESIEAALDYCRESPNIILKCVEKIIETAFVAPTLDQVDNQNLVAKLLKSSSMIQTSQLRAIVSYIGAQFAEDLQSRLKLAQMGFTEAQKSRNLLWSYLTGSLLELLLRQTGNLPLADKQQEINYRLYAKISGQGQ